MFRLYRATLCVVLLSMMACVNVQPVYLKEASKPDMKVFSAAKQMMERYKDQLQSKDGCLLIVDMNNGVLETDWHPVHKGEIERKIQIFVWGEIYRVDVWHKSYWDPFKIPKKDYMARLEEMQLQSKIHEYLIDN